MLQLLATVSGLRKTGGGQAVCQAEGGTHYVFPLSWPEAVQFLHGLWQIDSPEFPSLYPRPTANSGACSVASAR